MNIGEGTASHEQEYSGKVLSQADRFRKNQRSSDSDDGSDHGSLGSSPISHRAPSPESAHDKQNRSAQRDLDHKDERYVKLKATYTQHLTWSNNPRDLDLYGAFGEAKPNLSSDFHVEGLRPILKKDNSNMFLLRDAKEIYYLWDPWDGHLLQVSGEYATEDDLGDNFPDGLDGVEKIVSNIIGNLHWVLKDAKAVFRTS